MAVAVIPLDKVKRCVRLEMLYRKSIELLLHKPSHRDKDNLAYISVLDGGIPLVCASYQQSTITRNIVDSIDHVRLTLMTCVNSVWQHNAVGATL